MSKRCHYCKTAKGVTIDHIVPKGRGGPNAKWNYVEACYRCNHDVKGGSWPTCRCPVCALAIEIFEWYQKMGGGYGAAAEATDVFRHRLWDVRVGQEERWNDTSWIGEAAYTPRRSKRRRRFYPPPGSLEYQEWITEGAPTTDPD